MTIPKEECTLADKRIDKMDNIWETQVEKHGTDMTYWDKAEKEQYKSLRKEQIKFESKYNL